MSAKPASSSSSNDGDGSGGRKGLLSKVVKFVTNPTTQWSDLDRGRADAADAQSRQLLKEMIERKRRNDFVRNREFDMLRKLRRKEALTDEDRQGAASFYSSSGKYADTDERARTLKKIDEIEAQMSKSWLRRKGEAGPAAHGRAPAREAAPPPPQAEAPLEPVAVRAFAPTEPLDYEAVRSELERKRALAAASMAARAQTPPGPAAPSTAQPATAQPATPQPATAQPSSPAPPSKALLPSPMRLPPGFGGLSDFQVEVVAGTTKLDPAVEEAAIRFANGDAAGAEAGLRELVADGGVFEDNVDVWLTLFDLYRATNEQDKFDNTALQFAGRFGRSAPQWGVDAGSDSRPAAVAEVASAAPAGATAKFHWVCPSVINEQAIAALNTMMARQASPWRIDWRYLKTIEPASLPALMRVFQRWAGEPVRLKFFDVERLLQALAENSPAEDRQVDPLWWQVRLALLRALGEMEEFELAALNYCVTYEISPPAWEDPKNGYSPMTEEGMTIIEPEQQEPQTPPVRLTHGLEASDFTTGAATTVPPDDPHVARGELSGQLIGTVESALKQAIPAGPAKKSIEFNCRNLLRVDFGAAGELLNWSIDRKTEGRQVSFRQVNRLVAAFFGVIGITEAARVVLRVD